MYLPRVAESLLIEAMEVFPVVVVSGARQTGKSTLVQNGAGLQDRTYVTLDDPELRDQARRDAASILARARTLTIDEVQRAPDLLLAVKHAVDSDRPRQPGRFVLTGSANLLMMEKVSESLAGRAAYLTVWPLTRRERLGLGAAGVWSDLLDNPFEAWEEILDAQSTPPMDWREAVLTGGYPVPAYELASPRARALWFDGYIATYLERDLQTLSSVENLGDFRRLLRAAALRTGTVINQAEIARDVALSRPTAHRWLNLLETSYQAIRLDAYAVNRTKRLIKSPKLYWSDPGLALHLAGGEPTGAHLENLVACDLMTWRETRTPRPAVLFWRTVNGEEVDFVIESGARLIPIEVKAATRATWQDARHLRTFAEQYGDRVRGSLVIHTGDEMVRLDRSTLAVPWWRVL
jgi:uncharacterized protein